MEEWRDMWQRYRLPVAIGSGSLFLIITSIVFLVKSIQPTTAIRFSSTEATVSGAFSAGMTVDIAGTVRSPGVYRLPVGSRVEDGIIAAGGLSEDADEELIAKTINRAAFLEDGAKLYFPGKGMVQRETITSHNGIVQRDTFTSYNPVSINSASQAELEALSGIGPVTAQKIIAGRPYMSLEELVTKKAVGKALFEKLKGKISL